MNKEELLDLKDQIDTAKTEVNQLEGRKKGLLETLQTEWDCRSVEEAEKKLKSLQKKAEKITEKIEQEIEKLQKKYEFE